MSIITSAEIVPTHYFQNEGLRLNYGWSRELGEMLVEKSQEEHIQTMTPKDTEEFFADSKASEKWYAVTAKEPLVVWLGTLAGELAGMAYITNAKDSYSEQTSGISLFGVRVYEGFLNKGYGTVLSRELHELYDEVPRRDTQYTMLKDNNAAFSLGIKLGYRLKEIRGGTGDALTMVRKR